MIPVYWINLTRRPDKRKHMQKIINKYNSENKEKQIWNTRITPTKNIDYISCCISHFDAIHTAWQDGVDWAIICEDDIENFDFLNNPVLEKMLAKNDWHILQLYYTCPVLTEILSERIEKHLEQKIVKGYMMGACCYLINRTGMEKFLLKMSIYDTQLKEFNLSVNFLSNAKSEEFVFRYVDTRFLLIPLVNVVSLGSDITTSLNKEADKNMINIAKIHKRLYELNKDLQKLDFNDNIINIPYHSHWYDSRETCLKDLPL